MTSNSKEDQDQRKILGMEDSSMTIEFLRARLLAERSVSQTARQRAEELAERVLELEEQLKVVSLQRKKAEKATAAVLSILEDHGRSDASEEFDSDSNQEAGCSDSKGTESAGSKNERKPISSDLKEKKNYADTLSSSEIVSSPSTSRSLSWKSGKFSSQSFDRKKCTDSARRRCSSFASTGTSLPKRVGKSCRRIRRSSTRPAVDELRSTSGECASKVLLASANNVHQSLKVSPSNDDVKNRPHLTASEMSENQRKAYESDEDMERALQHKAQLIGKYEAEEKAQRKWEEKYRENNSYAQDSCDPGNYSDVTEERDDMKAFEQPYTTGIINSQNHANKFNEANIPSTDGVTDSNPSSVHTDTGCWKDQNCSKIVNSESPASEFTVSKPDGSYPENHGLTPAYSHHSSLSANGSPMHPSENTISSSGGTSSQGVKAVEREYIQALVSRNASNNIGSILGALEQAKFSLGQHINVLPTVKGGSSMEHTIPTTRLEDRLDIPPGCPGLFRLPTDFQPAVTTTGSYTGNRFSSLSTRPFLEVSSGVSSQRPIFENTLGTSISSSTGFDNLNPPSSLDIRFASKSTCLTYPFRPVVVPNLSSGEEVYLRSLPWNETGIPPSFHVSQYDAHLRPNMYR